MHQTFFSVYKLIAAHIETAMLHRCASVWWAQKGMQIYFFICIF